jgi:hypothetical protein
MFLHTQVVRGIVFLLVLIAIASCAPEPLPRVTAPVAALRDRAAVCATLESMDVLTETDAVIRLRGADKYRCDHVQREAVHLMRDPTANPSGDPSVAQFLKGLAYPQGSD